MSVLPFEPIWQNDEKDPSRFEADPFRQETKACGVTSTGVNDLARTLDDVAGCVRRYVVVSAAQGVAIALWTAHTYVTEAADSTPYLAITSAEKRSGKSRLLEVLNLLVRSPLPTANISDAALFRAINELSPTLLFDEVDGIFRSRDREDLRSLLNAGYRRGAFVFRCGGKKMTELESFPVFCPKAFAGIGNCLPDTITDRSIPIRLQRRTRDEQIERFRLRFTPAETEPIRVSLEQLTAFHIETLKAAQPSLPDELDDRAQDVWESLFALADVAGGDWPARARAAAIYLSTGVEREDDSLTANLISDIYTVFTETGEERLRTADLIEHLSEIEESPWGDLYGKPITAQALSKLLKAYRIRTMPVWVSGEKARGYKVEQFSDAFARVLDGRSGRDGRSESSTEAAPTTPTTPTAFQPMSDSELELEQLARRSLL